MRGLRRSWDARGAPPRLTAAPLYGSIRGVRWHPSPDRTYNEVIQDAQNTFQWHQHHLFRPHQHFTYDPSNWSRQLTEKDKAQRKLSLVERVRMEAEHAREAAESRQRSAELATVSLAAMDDYENGSDALKALSEHHSGGERIVEGTTTVRGEGDGDVSNSAWRAIPLQELIDEAVRLQQLLHSPRHGGNASLRVRAHQAQERNVVLTRILQRVESAIVNETVTLNALLYSWFVLLAHVTDLLGAMTQPGLYRTTTEPSVTEEEAINVVYAALESTLFRILLQRDSLYAMLADEADGGVELEAMIEAASIVLHPFAQRCAEAKGGSAALGALEEAALRICECLPARLVTRLTATDVEEHAEVSTNADASPASLRIPHRRRESLDPVHTRALALVTSSADRLIGATNPLNTLALRVLRRNAAYLEELLRMSTAARGSQARRAMLTRPLRARRVDVTELAGDSAELRQQQHPKALALDPSSAPRGVVTPLTDADDVGLLVEAMTALLGTRGVSAMTAAKRNSGNAGEDGETLMASVVPGSLGDVLDGLLALLSHTPNYDLDPSIVADLANAVFDAGLVASCRHPPWSRMGRQQHEEQPLGKRRQGTEEASLDAATERALRLLLLLTRVDLRLSRTRRPLAPLLSHLCLLPPPGSVDRSDSGEVPVGMHGRVGGRQLSSANARHEWQRLRGLAVRALLDTLRAEELDALKGSRNGNDFPANGYWLQAVAHGTYDGLIPQRLWREACERLLGYSVTVGAPSGSKASTHSQDSLDPRSAFALLCLRSRLCTESRESRRVPLDLVSLELAAHCVRVLSGDRIRVEELLSDPEKWAEAAGFLMIEGDKRSHERVLALLDEAKALLKKRERSAGKVVNL